MKAEREIKGLDNTSKISAKQRLKSGFEMHFLNAMTEMTDEEGNLALAARYIKKGAYPIFYANHTQHANIAGIRHVYHYLWGARPDNLYVAVANSLVNEGQDGEVVNVGKASAEILAQEHIQFVPLIRPKDLADLAGDDKRWRQNPNIRTKVHEHGNNMKFIESSFEKTESPIGTNGFAFFPEATTTGGIKKPDGFRTGMISVEHQLFSDLLVAAQKHDRDIVFIPLGMNGFNDIVEPRTREYRKKVIWWGVRESVGDHFGIGFSKKPAEVVVGTPFTLDDLRRDGLMVVKDGKSSPIDDNSKLNAYFMNKISPLLPEELQGVYKI